LVGAKTVNGPLPESVSTNPAAFTAATSVVWSAEFTAFSTMFFVLYFGAPPTIGLSPCAEALRAKGNATADANRIAKRVFLILLPPKLSTNLSNLPDIRARSEGG